MILRGARTCRRHYTTYTLCMAKRKRRPPTDQPPAVRISPETMRELKSLAVRLTGERGEIVTLGEAVTAAVRAMGKGRTTP